MILRDTASPVITSPNPVLRSETIKVTKFDETLTHLAERMTNIMDQSGGIGLAAPQISSLLQFAVVRIDDERVMPLVNPIIERKEGSEVAIEGCLSLPGLQVPVRRAEKILLRAQDLEGEEFRVELEGLSARIAQHEIDHLHGRLILDSLWRRETSEGISGEEA